jgi:thiamine-monophosphate kinase
MPRGVHASRVRKPEARLQAVPPALAGSSTSSTRQSGAASSHPVTISDIGEQALIARVRDRHALTADWVETGIGDDAAVLRPARGMVDVVTADSMVEDVHFRRGWSTWQDVGHRALAVNLSDLAAMGASPRALLLSLALPPHLPLADFDALIDGFLSEAARALAPLVGGNMTRSPGPLVIDVTAIGSARPRRILRRSGASPGDRVFVTGQLGAAAAGLAMREAGVNTLALDDEQRACVQRYDRPDARLRTGVIVANNRAASACMDLSDGLADAVTQIARASQCGIELDAGAIPIHRGAAAWAAASGGDARALGWSGGEDYELVFAVPKRRTRLFLTAIRQAGETTVTEIGVCTKDREVCAIANGSRHPLPAGFSHF